MVNKDKIILGINGMNIHTHDASACLLINGKLIAASSEERFTGVKHTADFPVEAIKFCLKQGDIKISDVTDIVYPFSPTLRLKEGIKYFIANLPESLKLLSFHPFKDLLQKKGIANLLAMKLEIPRSLIKAEIRFVEHHLAHAASCFYASPFFEAAILTVDGIGEMDSGMISKGIGTRIIPVKKIKFPDSLGLIYRAITVHLGFVKDGEEGKVMGLSSYGDASLVNKFKKLYTLTEDGFFINRDYFNTLYYPTDDSKIDFVTDKFKEEFGEPRNKDEELTAHHMNLAHALQENIERIMLHLGNLAVEMTGFKNLCMAGGVALNSCGNGRILKEGKIKNIYIQPASADDGASLGAAMYVAVNEHGHRLKNITRMPYYGMDISDTIDEDLLERLNLDIEKLKNPPLEIAQLIFDGKIIGFAQGKAEFGPRALGNRSILADPRIADNKKRLNEIIKKREWFRPFAPVVTIEDAGKYFDGCVESPHMLLVFDVKEEFIEKLPAITHVDNTARVQTLRREDNEYLYNILKEFEVLSSYPMLLNTSFNGPGKPLENNFKDALKTLIESELDILIINDLIIKKTGN